MFFFREVDWRALVEAFWGARPLPLVGVVLVTGAAYAARAWRWGDILAPLGRVGHADLLSATVVGYAASLVVPRSGELLRPWLISRRHPIRTSAGFATIIIERLVDLVTVLVLLALCLLVLPAPASQLEGASMELLKIGAATAAIAAAGILAFLLALHSKAEQMVGGLERLFARAPRWLAEPLAQLLRTFSAGLVSLRAPYPHLAKIGLQSLAVWLLTALAFHLNHMAFAIDLPFHATFVLIAFLTVGEAIPTPGLVGGFHAFYLLALSGIYGIDATIAVAAGITAHALTNLPVLAAGCALLGREGLSLGRAIEPPQGETDSKEAGSP